MNCLRKHYCEYLSKPLKRGFDFSPIRFWTMANTFTGLKLQGQIGKFGAKELSDIEGWCLLHQFFYREDFFFGGGGRGGG